MSEIRPTVRVLVAPGHRVLDPGTGLPIPELEKGMQVSRDRESGVVTVRPGLGVELPRDSFARRRLAEGGLIEVEEAAEPEAAAAPAEAAPAGDPASAPEAAAESRIPPRRRGGQE